MLLLDMPTFLPVTKLVNLSGGGSPRDAQILFFCFGATSWPAPGHCYIYVLLILLIVLFTLAMQINNFTARRHFAAGQTITAPTVLQYV
ncbi:MAG TPA: hypothetical protein DIC36_10200 [Gammaproteobacteria bacterium]|nr:hypothetical protein [Gammaproteobacteria bacterium]